MAQMAASSQQDNLWLDWFPRTLQQANSQLEDAMGEMKLSRDRQASLQDELDSTRVELNAARSESEYLRKTLESTKTELMSQLDGWMNKRSSDLIEYKTAEAHWKQERKVLKEERQKWLEERGELEHELYRLRAEIASYRGKGKSSAPKFTSIVGTNETLVCPQSVEKTSQGFLSYLSNVGIGDTSNTAVDDSMETTSTTMELGLNLYD